MCHNLQKSEAEMPKSIPQKLFSLNPSGGEGGDSGGGGFGGDSL